MKIYRTKVVAFFYNFKNLTLHLFKNGFYNRFSGILGPEASSEAEETSAFLSSLSKEYQLYQFLFSATSSNLNDERLSNIVRVIPSDTIQTKVNVYYTLLTYQVLSTRFFFLSRLFNFFKVTIKPVILFE